MYFEDRISPVTKTELDEARNHADHDLTQKEAQRSLESA
jgi:hypothetical protein